MSIPDSVTVDAVIKSAEMPAEGDKDYKAALEIPYFRSKYPTTVYVPVTVVLKKGQPITLNLTKGKLSKDDYDGSAWWHFTWRWAGIAAPDAHAASTAASSKPPARTDATGISIERQVALKEARLATEYLLKEEDRTPEQYGALWQRMFRAALWVFYDDGKSPVAGARQPKPTAETDDPLPEGDPDG